jgi:hypothetical protein
LEWDVVRLDVFIGDGCGTSSLPPRWQMCLRKCNDEKEDGKAEDYRSAKPKSLRCFSAASTGFLTLAV